MPKPDARRWCHAIWRTYRHHKLFKIAATARFCERLLRHTCVPAGWSVDTVSVQDDSVQVLVRVPADVPRDAVVARLQRALTVALVNAGIVASPHTRIWDDRHWCAVLSNAAGVAAVRKHIAARSSLGEESTVFS